METPKEFDPPCELFYKISLKNITHEVYGMGKYEPDISDLIAFTNIR